MDFHCQSPITDIKKHPLPQLEDLVEGVNLHTAAGLKYETKHRKELNRALHEAGNLTEWFPTGADPFTRDLIANKYIEAGGAMTPGRVHDLEGAKHIVMSYKKEE